MKKWYNKNDEKILEPFYDKLHKYLNRKHNIFRFYFGDDEQMVVRYFCEADSDNNLDLDDPNYEDLFEINFEILKFEKPTKNKEWKKYRILGITYQNIPDRFEVVEDFDEESKK